MANYGKFLFYRKNSAVIQTQYVSNTLTVEYDISAYVSNTLTLLYNILSIDARSLWEPKEIDKALWEPLPANDPASYPDAVVEESVGGVLLLESGGQLLLESGGSILLE